MYQIEIWVCLDALLTILPPQDARTYRKSPAQSVLDDPHARPFCYPGHSEAEEEMFILLVVSGRVAGCPARPPLRVGVLNLPQRLALVTTRSSQTPPASKLVLGFPGFHRHH